MLEALVVAVAALAASTLAGVTGFGGAVVLLPALVWAVGARDAVVALTVAQLAGNGSRVIFNLADVDRAVLGRFAVGAVPAALVGGALFASISPGVLARALGAFMVSTVIVRHMRRAPAGRPPLRRFTALGTAFGFLSSLLGSVGPAMAPFFLAYGLVKGAYIGTEAACTVVIHATKLVAYGGGGVLGGSAASTGLAISPVMIAGSWVGKQLLDRTPERVFVALIDAVLVLSGALLIARG